MTRPKRPKARLTPKQREMIKELEARFEALSEAMLQSELMDELSSYLQRGQRFASLTLKELHGRWASAFKQFAAEEHGPHVRDMDDAGAEIRHRGLRLPVHLVSEEFELIRERIRREGPDELDEKIDDFFEQLKKPKN
jgi:hypothetical protein